MKHPLFDVARRTVADSCLVADSVQKKLDDVRAVTKDDRSPVTVADFAVQAIVALDLLENDCDVNILGEEKADLLRRPENAAVLEAVVQAVRCVRPDVSAEEVLEAIDGCDHDASAKSYWTLDPVDGTKGFLRGQQYAIALALIENGRVMLGMMGCPNLPIDHSRSLEEADPGGSIYAAVLGEGAWEMSRGEAQAAPRRVEASRFQQGRPIRACESVESAHTSQSDSARIIDELGGASDPVRLDSQCKYAVVARGQADAYLRLPTKKGYVEKIWDHAAGSLIAMEAGAVVSDITGSPLDFSHGATLEANSGIICAIPPLHERIIETIERLRIGGRHEGTEARRHEGMASRGE